MEEVEDKVIVLIPAYEPDDKLIDLVKKIKYDVIVVNDGSSSKYDPIFEEVKKYAKVIGYASNHGKGYALKTGFKYIKNNYDKYIVVTMDADGQHSVNDIEKLCNYVKINRDVLVLGKRIRDKKVPIRSYLGNSITRVIYKLATKTDIYDTQTGFRAFGNELMDFHLNIPGDRFEYEMNVLLYGSNKIKIKEIEIETIYIDNNKSSHFNALKDSYKIYKQIITFSFSSILSFIIDYLLYTLFILSTNNLILSNIVARIISGSINYCINKNIVFKSKENALLKYILLAVIIITLNTIVLNVLVYIGINKFIAKIITELILFVFSYLIQKKIIFKEAKN